MVPRDLLDQQEVLVNLDNLAKWDQQALYQTLDQLDIQVLRARSDLWVQQVDSVYLYSVLGGYCYYCY